MSENSDEIPVRDYLSIKTAIFMDKSLFFMCVSTKSRIWVDRDGTYPIVVIQIQKKL